jgi:hypothetical protein
VTVRFAGVPQVDDLAFHADGGFFAPVAGDDLPVQDHMSEAVVFGPFQCLVQAGGLFGEDRDHFVPVPVGGGPGNAMVAGQCVRGGAVAEPPQAQHRLPKQVSALLPVGVPRRRPSAHSSFAVNWTSSLGTSSVAR